MFTKAIIGIYHQDCVCKNDFVLNYIYIFIRILVYSRNDNSTEVNIFIGTNL